MDLKEALHYFASQVWSKGEIGSASGCLVPTWYAEDGITDYNIASDVIYKRFGKTHYDRHWKTRGKTVQLNFYRAEAFGAATPNPNTKLSLTVTV